MDVRKFGEKIYLRLDKGDELLTQLLQVCHKTGVLSATFHGIGAFDQVRVATYIPEKGGFLDHEKEGMLELLSLDGNITHDEGGQIYEHAHAMFSYLDERGEVCFFGGHLKSAVVSYTAEIVIESIPDTGIGRMTDPYTGITVWNLH